MTRIKYVGVGVIAAMAVILLVVSSASAAEEKTKMLPESGITFVSKAGKGKLSILGLTTAVNCEKGKGSGTVESANLGKGQGAAEECHFNGVATNPCTGAGDASGVILSSGTFHFWLALETLNGVANTLVGAFVSLPEETHFTCVVAGLNQLFLAKGCDAALATPLNTLAATVKATLALAGGVAGDQLITKVLPQEATSAIECVGLVSVNGGAFTMAAGEGVAEFEKFLNASKEAVTALLMNPEGKE
jgi:hypothetical protein